jgi:small subunit ribosomal protein S16
VTAKIILLDLSLWFSIMEPMLAIKLQRIGKKHQPSYRLVVAEKRSKMAAPPVEDLGAYDPRSKATTIKKERVAHWVKMGAQPTTTAHNLLVKEGAITAPKKVVKMPKAIAKAAVSVEEKPAAAVEEGEASPAATAETEAQA